MYLLDTVVLSELWKKNRNPGVTKWFNKRREPELYISVLSLGEIRRGIYMQEGKDYDFVTRLTKWLHTVLLFYENRILPVIMEVALEWGIISGKTGNKGIDNLIAATAKVYNFTVVTRNVRHFEMTGVRLLNPWT